MAGEGVTCPECRGELIGVVAAYGVDVVCPEGDYKYKGPFEGFEFQDERGED